MQDVLWSNVGLSSTTYLGAAVLAWALFALLAIFYLIPVGAVQALLQVDKLDQYKFFRVIMDVSSCCTVVSAIIPLLIRSAIKFARPRENKLYQNVTGLLMCLYTGCEAAVALVDRAQLCTTSLWHGTTVLAPSMLA